MSTRTIPGRRPVLEALRAGRRIHEVLVDGDAPEGLADAARAAGVGVRRVDRDALDAAAEGVRHQGVVAVAGPYPYVELTALRDRRLVVVLDRVTDPQNLGAIARSAHDAGADGLVVLRRRAAQVGPAAEKAAAGALSWIDVARAPGTVHALDVLRDAGMWTVGLDGDAPTTLWRSRLLDDRVALVVGAEGDGLARLVRERVDERIAIPMGGRIASLNASAAAAVALFEIARRHA